MPRGNGVPGLHRGSRHATRRLGARSLPLPKGVFEMSTRLVLVLALTFCVMALVSGLAVGAEDKKGYPGIGCHALDPDHEAYLAFDGTLGFVENDGSAGSVNIVCPAVADCGALYSTGHTVVLQHDAEAGAQSGCMLCRRDMNSGSESCGSYVTTSEAVSTRQFLSPVADTTASFTYGTTWVVCYLSGSSHNARFHGFQLDENC